MVEQLASISLLASVAANVPFQPDSGYPARMDRPTVKEVATSPVTDLIPGIRAFRPFLPAKDFETSLRFYDAMGFGTYRLGEALAEMSLGSHAFLLQGRYVKAWADNMVMHVLVRDVQSWWQHIQSLDLANRFGVSPPAPPRAESWGLTVLYVTDPAGVLWHFAESTKVDGKER
jgi:hypothetical protein